jgi:hypothetical protein
MATQQLAVQTTSYSGQYLSAHTDTHTHVHELEAEQNSKYGGMLLTG